ncbi:hypothetical protein [Natronosalvus rutilus]|uniref:Uncharacterized protein n=1 Tax=Natronosalvus rutilus TaxID=2953753 RepID=A0A9E7NCA7_9EURY|nr:hypothetical protein [Natronosalvus rutilus]UTF55829.1 hypothetical protein NGM29_20310 [Natronosalvus rutilus]
MTSWDDIEDRLDALEEAADAEAEEPPTFVIQNYLVDENAERVGRFQKIEAGLSRGDSSRSTWYDPHTGEETEPGDRLDPVPGRDELDDPAAVDASGQDADDPDTNPGPEIERP